MQRTPEQLAATIAALEAQRAILGDEVVDTALAPLRSELAAMRLRDGGRRSSSSRSRCCSSTWSARRRWVSSSAPRRSTR